MKLKLYPMIELILLSLKVKNFLFFLGFLILVLNLIIDDI